MERRKPQLNETVWLRHDTGSIFLAIGKFPKDFTGLPYYEPFKAPQKLIDQWEDWEYKVALKEDMI